MKTILFIIVTSLLGAASAGVPNCLNKKVSLDIDNHQAINLRDFMEQGFKTRALVDGTLVIVMANRQGHTHLEIDLDRNFETSDDRLEVIYNNEYGDLPELQVGDQVTACGDFIVDKHSPHKAIIHWLHKSPNLKSHDHGFLAINGTTFGR